MKTSLIALSALLVSLNSVATENNYSFVASDESEYSNMCVIAAEQGLDAAKKHAANFDNSTICNGVSITKFAKKYSAKAQQPARFAAVKIVAADSNVESQLCAQAAKSGIASLGLAQWKIRDIYCNGQTISRFARSYAK